MSSSNYHEFLAPLCAITKEAGALIMPYFGAHGQTRKKSDNSPVTDADELANALITERLLALAPDILIIAEENTTNHQPPATNRFWLVDPLDGTRAFVNGEPEFTVNIGLIIAGEPVLGVIYSPADGRLYYGAKGVGAFKDGAKIQVRTPPDDGLTVVRSKSHPSKQTEAFLQTLHIKELISGSSSIKFCQVAEGSADVYPRFGRTMEWDTAAGHAILNAAGGYVVTEGGNSLTYGKVGYENPGFVGWGYIRTGN